ncbi:hypothetical protein BD410DRAFT_536124 [Rickenella mellea]|uniref:Aminoglycoside phosphotransferase domain-containing protein n=1 Tax=Rickenella mellea TaxID=50990 RepID=A0A4Y7PSD3_9AGAM|nr:hypothetical protein BD410DRAFT_536124 [Rickenella mellea]
MPDDMDHQISQLQKKPEWANFHGLISCAESRLSKSSCTSISYLGYGSSNVVYKLTFSDLSSIAASVAKKDEERFNPEAKLSEIATMAFVRDSGLYPNIPVPRVHAWDVTFTNPAGAPYIFMDFVEGKVLDEVKNSDGLTGLDALSNEEQLSIVQSLASIQASLSKPVPFDQIGSLNRSEDGKFSVGPLCTSKTVGGPFKSLHEYWRSLLRAQFLHAMEEWSGLQTDIIPGCWFESNYRPQDFSNQIQFLSALEPHFIPPPQYLRLVLHHPDLALRNIIFDHQDPTKVKAVIDWGGAQILPLILTAKFPDDLQSRADDPFPCTGYPDEKWLTVPNDWVSCRNAKSIPTVYVHGKPAHPVPRAQAMVKRYFLRQYFSSCYAQSIFTIHGDKDLARARLFADAPYYLKFHEVLTDGWECWPVYDTWIKETYSRLQLLGHRKDDIIIGPNTYAKSTRSRFCDLGVVERSVEGKSSGGVTSSTSATSITSTSSGSSGGATVRGEKSERPTTERVEGGDAIVGTSINSTSGGTSGGGAVIGEHNERPATEGEDGVNAIVTTGIISARIGGAAVIGESDECPTTEGEETQESVDASEGS